MTRFVNLIVGLRAGRTRTKSPWQRGEVVGEEDVAGDVEGGEHANPISLQEGNHAIESKGYPKRTKRGRKA